MGDVDTDRILDGGDVSEAVEGLHERQMVDALAGVINGVAQLQENLGDVVGTGDPNRWVGTRRRAAGWKLVLDSLKNDMLRQHNGMAAHVGKERITDDTAD